MAITRTQLYKELVPGLHALFGMEYARYPEQHKEIYDVTSSSRAWEEEVKLSGFGSAPVKDEGDSIAYDHAQEAWTARYTHVTIAQGFALTEEAFEDNLYDSLANRYTKALARSMAYTKQVRAAELLNTGFTSYQSGDGVFLFSASHPLINGGTNSNLIAADLNETALEDAVIQISKWTDERGLLIAAMPTKLIIPVDLQFVATRILENPNRPGTADRDINALVKNGNIGGHTINNWLTDTDAWFLKTDVPDGMKMFVRSAMKKSSDVDFDTGNMKYKARERYSFGVSDPLGIFGSAGV